MAKWNEQYRRDRHLRSGRPDLAAKPPRPYTIPWTGVGLSTSGHVEVVQIKANSWEAAVDEMKMLPQLAILLALMPGVAGDLKPVGEDGLPVPGASAPQELGRDLGLELGLGLELDPDLDQADLEPEN